MRLLTHNMLTSKCVKGVMQGYPLGIQATKVQVMESDFNKDFVTRVIPKLDYSTLWNAAKTLGYSAELPETLVENYEGNEEFLRKVHHVLLEIEVVEGDLICPETGRKFPITSGIPNMLLNEDEVRY
ncbi:Trm112p-like protein [Nesidiocoris tenuis]|uniref:Multifunctional methyltransferase subunit TRM112-like protein n=1 Tax=Nesidiocoris tenuis TaxID=355587 RepID=A0ABN7ABK7_9HEMI|nr:Trm112p-like protein [Nesidiocoris tenuis]